MTLLTYFFQAKHTQLPGGVGGDVSFNHNNDDDDNNNKIGRLLLWPKGIDTIIIGKNFLHTLGVYNIQV
ncbi:hypothetical protein BLA29_008262 [Euroglyphus maynei]|uniref:Uncharacterized protein n=1 Tax=Euroglyphus maynei TaxID=6958 RepID=A0A1Y3AUX6_EURMA|nr:hypothetical protein BLA29_008262 [Euroglyphus maynei]